MMSISALLTAILA